MSYTVIRDKNIEPFYITVDQYNYNLVEVIKPQRKNLSKDSEAKEYERVIGHFSSLGMLIKALTKSKTITKNQYNSIKEYLNEFKRQEEVINNLINNI
jgi:hypothetical protein